MMNFKPSLILLVGLLGLGSAGCDKFAQARKLAERTKDATSNDVDYFDDAMDIPKQPAPWAYVTLHVDFA